MPHRSAIEPVGSWQSIPGYVYGLSQPCLQGSVRINSVADKTATLFADQLSSLLVESFPHKSNQTTEKNTPKETPEAPADQIVHNLCFWTGSILRQNRIPTAYQYHLFQEDQTPAQFKICLPSYRMHATHVVLHWLISHFNRLHHQPASLGHKDERLALEFNNLEQKLQRFASSLQNPIFIYQSALELNIPIRTLSQNLFALGYGASLRQYFSTITDQTPNLAVASAKSKSATAKLLKQLGLPSPEHRRVGTLEEAKAVARQLGYPVVLKPDDRDQGQGVYVGLHNAAALTRAFPQAAAVSGNLLIERQIPGFGHRLTICNGRLIKATRKLPAGITGDGKKTILALIEEQNAKNAERRLFDSPRPPLRLDETALNLLRKRDLTPTSVPPQGEDIPLRDLSNHSVGGRTQDIPVEHVHPDNRILAQRAATALGLDIAGIDLITIDLTRSWLECDAVICEINAQPQTDMATIKRILLQPGLGNYRIPTHLFVHPSGMEHLLDSIAHNLAVTKGCNGWSTTNGVWIDHAKVTQPFADAYNAAQALLNSREVTSALCLLGEQDILRFGLPAEHFDSLTYADDLHPYADTPYEPPQALKEMIAPHVRQDRAESS